LGVKEAIFVSSVFGIVGLILLWMINPSSCILGFLALFSYVAIYTPLKTKTPLVVLIGAFPGSVPPLLGYVAASNAFGLEAGILFLVQFFWQFPHFWAIAWRANDDYLKAGFKMLPLIEGRVKGSSWLILLFAMFMLPVSLLPWAFDMTHGIITIIIASTATFAFIWPAYKLYRTGEMKEATRLMFVSFFYLPVVQIAYIIDKI
ncbi:MAG: protoheme IX farnesyltransferase, partial [Crocinitomicaceae bacterium]|nr:protoheme IX farnesyltransferase [Crocinitomicaceae bacterium]